MVNFLFFPHCLLWQYSCTRPLFCILIPFGLASCSEKSAPSCYVHSWQLVVQWCVHVLWGKSTYLLMNHSLFNGRSCQIYSILIDYKQFFLFVFLILVYDNLTCDSVWQPTPKVLNVHSITVAAECTTHRHGAACINFFPHTTQEGPIYYYTELSQDCVTSITLATK